MPLKTCITSSPISILPQSVMMLLHPYSITNMDSRKIVGQLNDFGKIINTEFLIFLTSSIADLFKDNWQKLVAIGIGAIVILIIYLIAQ